MQNRIAAALRKTAAVAIVFAAGLVMAASAALSSGPPAEAAARQPVVIVTDWAHAFPLMAHHGYWCALEKAPKLECTYYPWWRVSLIEWPVSFRTAVQDLQLGGAAITRIRPHLWLLTSDWF